MGYFYITHNKLTDPVTGELQTNLEFIKNLEARPAGSGHTPGLRETLLKASFKSLSMQTKLCYARFFVPYYLDANEYTEALILLTACGLAEQNKTVAVSDLEDFIKQKLQHIEVEIRVASFIDRLNACAEDALSDFFVTHHGAIERVVFIVRKL